MGSWRKSGGKVARMEFGEAQLPRRALDFGWRGKRADSENVSHGTLEAKSVLPYSCVGRNVSTALVKGGERPIVSAAQHTKKDLSKSSHAVVAPFLTNACLVRLV